MPKRSSKPKTDEVASAFDTLQHIIESTESQAPGERVDALQRLCWEVHQFGQFGKLPQRVLDALRAAALGRPIPATLLPIVMKEDFPEPDAPAVTLGRLGGLKGGAARASALSPTKRKAIAKKAAAARWGKVPK